MEKEQLEVFSKQSEAANYDDRFAPMSPFKDALHLLMKLILIDLPKNARVLCVGVGTGAELIYLAKAFPEWHFTAVEPAAAMLNICREKLATEGLINRCELFEGYIDEFPPSEPFHAATSILVSQFITELQERKHFFANIHSRLREGGYLISADLTDIQQLKNLWMTTYRFCGLQDDEIAQVFDLFGKKIALLGVNEMEQVIESGGFNSPALFFQTIWIHGWFARKAAH